MKNPYLFLLFFTTLFLSGCAQDPAPQTMNRSDIESKPIAVIPFGNDSVDFTGKLAAEIAKQSVDGKAGFTVVSRTDVTQVIHEQNRNNSAPMDISTTIKIGKHTGAKATVSGHLDAPTFHDDYYYVERTKCQGEQCWRVKVACIKRTIGLSTEIKMINVSTADILYGENVYQEKEWNRCADDTKTLPSKYTGVQELADAIAKNFADKLTQAPLKSGF